jgi:multidrug efflux pump
VTVPLTAGQLTTPEQFAAIVLRPAPMARAWCWATWPASSWARRAMPGHARGRPPATAAAVQLRPGQCGADRQGGARAHGRLPHCCRGRAVGIPFDTAPFVKISIEKVVQTLLEAMLLVFLVMYLFLQNCATR